MNTATLLADLFGPLHEWLLSLGAMGIAAWIVLKILAIAVPVILAVAFYVVWERKLLGWMHVRHGPMYVGLGVFQAFADVFKLLFKEVIQPTNARTEEHTSELQWLIISSYAVFCLEKKIDDDK